MSDNYNALDDALTLIGLISSQQGLDLETGLDDVVDALTVTDVADFVSLTVTLAAMAAGFAQALSPADDPGAVLRSMAASKTALEEDLNYQPWEDEDDIARYDRLMNGDFDNEKGE